MEKVADKAATANTDPQVFFSREEAENADLVSMMSQIVLDTKLDESNLLTSQESIDLSENVMRRYHYGADKERKKVKTSVLKAALESSDPQEALTLALSPEAAQTIVQYCSAPVYYETTVSERDPSLTSF